MFFLLSKLYVFFCRKFSILLSSSQKHYIKAFSAEAFAFLIRKSKSKENVIEFILEQISEGLTEGIGYLLFHTVKGIKTQLNLNAEEYLAVILNSLYTVTTNNKSEVSFVKYTYIQKLCKALIGL